MTEPKPIGKYQIIEEIGRGGFAAVYKARDTDLDRIVALKVMHTYRTEDPTFVARFRQEARTAANLRHPSIVTVYETGEIEGQLYIAMEHLPGRTLEVLLRDEGVLPLERALPILEQMADALDYAHEQGVVHRDVKPGNVMVEETGRGLQVTLMDFGLVRALESSTALTQEGTLLGSPEYIAPEQANPERVAEIGPATDRYALGIVAYQMLSGRVPFLGNTPATLNAHLNIAPPDPQSIRRGLSNAVMEALLKMLAKAPADRFESARAFVERLRDESGVRQPEVQLVPPPKARPGSQLRLPSPAWVWIAVAVVVGCGLIALAAACSPARIFPPPTPRPTAAIVLSVLAAGDLTTRTIDGMVMVYVPAGEFLMGSSDAEIDAAFEQCEQDYGSGKCKRERFEDESPQHTVNLDAFRIDRTEVTNAQYNKCVEAGERDASNYAGDSRYNAEDQPVVGVSRYDAKAYCEWAGGALPTEAQWEKAARGTEGWIYPWGNGPVAGDLLNYCDKNCTYDWKDDSADDGYALTAPAGNYPNGASPYGALDMAGNVWEWVADWYAGYSSEVQVNPTGPEDGSGKVLRGGSFDDMPGNLRAAHRLDIDPGLRSTSVGFRCARLPEQ